jgi:hypothetical protein
MTDFKVTKSDFATFLPFSDETAGVVQIRARTPARICIGNRIYIKVMVVLISRRIVFGILPFSD